MKFRDFISDLEKKMKGTLPGLSSQLKMAGARRFIRDGKVIAPDDARLAGVLALFYPRADRIFIVFMKRTEYPGIHSGQISFPGGGNENGDKDMVDTALREAEEEIGVPASSVRTLGQLTELYIPPSNFRVTPVVGYTLERPDFRPDPEEVDQILEFDLEDLLNDKNRQEKDITLFPAVTIRVPCFYIDGHVIWGATAMMLNELIELINRKS